MNLIPESELVITTFSDRPKGGQQVGVTDVGIKIIHIPTGITAICSSARSQNKNKLICLDMIESALTNPNL